MPPAQPQNPLIPGFGFGVAVGGWWEFSRVYEWKGAYPEREELSFVLILAEEVSIADEPAYRVEVRVQSEADYRFDWPYLSFVGHRIRGSKGTTYETLFDAMTGRWPSTTSGFFGSLLPGGVLAAEAVGGDWKVGPAIYDSTGCEVIPGYGTICTESPSYYQGYDLFRPGVGPAGSHRTGCSEAACEYTTYELIDASPDGAKELPPYARDEEVEPECPSDGFFCGSALADRDANTLYTCLDGEVAMTDPCDIGCRVQPGDDACEPCPNGDGSYCGGHGIPGEPDVLYQCSNGWLLGEMLCPEACFSFGEGSNDSCVYEQ